MKTVFPLLSLPKKRLKDDVPAVAVPIKLQQYPKSDLTRWAQERNAPPKPTHQ